MALKIGDINFGVFADTRGLKAATDELRRFSVAVNKAARSNDEAAQKSVGALARQESAIKSALLSTLNLQRAMRTAGAPPNLISQTTRSFQKLTREMSSGRLSMLEFTRATDAFNARLGRINRSFKDFRAKKAGAEVSKLSTVMRDLESSAVLAVGPLSGIGARIRAIGAIANRSTLQLTLFFGAITGGIVGFGALVKGAITTAQALEKVQAALLAASGSAITAGQDFKFITEQARTLGVDLASSAEQYAQMAAAARGTVLEGEGVRDVFKGIASASAALRLSSDQTRGALRAVQQMMSKGTVQAEELRGQLGERIPGAFQLASKAMGVSTRELNKMLEQGQVLAEDFLPKFAKLLNETFGEAAKNADTLGKAQNNLSTSVTLFNKAVDDALGFSGLWRETLKDLALFVDGAANNMDKLVGAAGAVTGALIALSAGKILKGLAWMVGLIRQATVAMLALNAASLTFGGVIGVLLRLGAVAGGAAIGFRLFSAAVEDTVGVNVSFIKSANQWIDQTKKIGTSSRATTNSIIEDAQARIKALEAEIRARQLAYQALVKQRQDEGFFKKGVRAVAGATFLDKLFGVENPEDIARDLLFLRKNLGEMETVLQGLQKLPTSSPAASVGEATSNKLSGASKRVSKLLEDIKGIQAALSSPTAGVGELNRDLAEAQKLLIGLSQADLNALRTQLGAAGFEGNSTAEALAKLFGAIRVGKQEYKDWTAAVKATPQILKDVNAEISQMNMEISAMRAGPQAFEDLKAGIDIAKKVAKVREELEKTTLSTTEVTAKTEEYRQKMIELASTTKEFEKIKDVIKTIEDGFDKAFDRIGDAITDALVKGKTEALSFKNLMNAVASEVHRALLQALVIEPLKQQVMGSVSSALSAGGGGGFLGSIFGSIFGGGGVGFGATAIPAGAAGLTGPELFLANGGLVRGGFGAAGIVKKPTLGVVGEGSMNEAVVPLPDGRSIPVEMQGGGGGTVINNYFSIAAPSGSVGRETQSQIAERVAGSLARATRRNR